MDKPIESIKILSLFNYPVFLVKDGLIADMNQAAKQLLIPLSLPVANLIKSGNEEYENYHGGYLSLSVSVMDVPRMAVVSRTEIGDLFHLQEEADSVELRTMALIAQRLRQPLSDLMLNADTLFPEIANQGNPDFQQRVGKLNRSLYQLLREITNLSVSVLPGSACLYDIKVLFTDLMERIKSTAFAHNCQISYEVSNGEIYGLVNADLLERALHNMISNAIKFSPEGSLITAKMEQVEKRLKLSVENQYAPGTDTDNIFFRYLRNPGLEDSRYGIGMGLFLIQKIAFVHNGCLLMDHPKEDRVRFTLTIPLRQKPPGEVHSPILNMDYLGGRDHMLVELSDVLPSSAFNDVN